MQLNPIKRWNQFIERIGERERRQQSPIHLGMRRIFIMPTRSGLIFAMTLMAMLIGSINYNNSLGFILTFTLVGLGLMAILHTFRNLFRTTLHVKHAMPIYAGGIAHFSLTLSGEGAEAGGGSIERRAIEVVTRSGVVRGVDVAEEGTATIDLAQQYNRRGLHYLNRMTIRSIYPLGLFRAWAPVNLDAHVVVYPRAYCCGTTARTC